MIGAKTPPMRRWLFALLLISAAATLAGADEDIQPPITNNDIVWPYFKNSLPPALPRLQVQMPALDGFLWRARSENVDLLFDGDGSVDVWSTIVGTKQDLPPDFSKYRDVTAVLGCPGEQVQNLLWRVRNGELDGLNPKVIVVGIGYENLLQNQKPDDVVAGIQLVLQEYHKACPNAHVALTSIFPQQVEQIPTLAYTNALLAKLAKVEGVTFLDLGDKVTNPQGSDRLKFFADLFEACGNALQPLLDQYLPDSDMSKKAPPDFWIEEERPKLNYPFPEIPPAGVPVAAFPVPNVKGIHEFEEEYAKLRQNPYDVICDGGAYHMEHVPMEIFGSAKMISLGPKDQYPGNLIWRLQHGEVAAQKPKLVVLSCEYLNYSVAVIQQEVDAYEKACPEAHIVLVGPMIIGQWGKAAVDLNKALTNTKFDDRVTFVDERPTFLDANGDYITDYWPLPGQLSDAGRKAFADMLSPVVKSYLPPATTR